MTDLFCFALDAIKNTDGRTLSTVSQNWETAAQKFDEAADVCRRAAQDLASQKEAEERPAPAGVPNHVFDFLQDYLKPGPHQVLNILTIPSNPEINQLLLNSLVKGNHR